ncbi:MAG: hemerythrin domain-containing protein [Chloroflexota bacterium]|nr:hemerythrin domain-containing protein [Chloroflexota bacterium]
MKRDPRLVRLSEEHHHGLVFALRLERELPDAGDAELAALYGDLLRFWARGLLPHFHAETECLIARLVRHVPDDDDRVRRIQRDHLGMEALVAHMRDASGDEERRDALATFGETLRAHIRWEERVLFESLQTDLSEAELDAAGAEILDRLPKPTRSPWVEE